jgi:acyl carrier protein
MIPINEFISKLKEALEIENEDVKPETNIREFSKWSSMNALILIALFETDFDTTLSGGDLQQCHTVLDLYNHIKNNP